MLAFGDHDLNGFSAVNECHLQDFALSQGRTQGG